MVPVDKGTRDLLPPFQAHAAEIAVAETPDDAGSFAPADALELEAAGSAIRSAADPPSVERDVDWEPIAMPIGPTSSTAAAHGWHAPQGEPVFIPISVAEGFRMPTPPAVSESKEANGHDHGRLGQDGWAEPNEDDAHRPSDIDGGSIEREAAHRINVTQVAVVDQDASIIVNGYVGEVVARLYIDQDLTMDQNVDVAVTIDGDGRFVVLLDQDMRIDQTVEIDLDIFDIDGVLYVDLFLHDSIEVEQDTAIDVRIGVGPPGGRADVNQDMELHQDVSIEMDIEDELEERYDVDIEVDVIQAVDAEQDAVVDIRASNGGTELDLDAVQTAAIAQQVIVEADLVLA